MSIELKIHKNGELVAENLPEVIENYSLRSETIQEIISRKPGFMERWALLLYLFILLVVFAGTWFIKYPDIIQTSATLTAANAPKEIVIRQDGKLIRLFANNDDTILQGQTIGWIESTANHKEVIALSDLLDTAEYFMAENKTELVSDLFSGPFKNLGELQAGYQQFITAWQQFNDYLVNGYYQKRKKILLGDYLFLQKMHKTIELQQQLTQQDLLLTREAFEANDSLYKDKVISKQDFRDQKSKLVGKQMSVPQLESTLLTNENMQANKRKDIAELEHNISQQKMIFHQALQTLKSAISEWELKYIIKAPVDGKIVFVVPLQENQFLQSGKTIGYINPADSRYYAQVTLPQYNFGKINMGQKVQLRFDAYPYQEFGFVAGKINYISKVPTDSGFLANISVPKSLITNYNKQIQYRSGLKSQALIVTRDSRLLQRFYYDIIKAVHDKN